MSQSRSDELVASYLARPPEALVVEGFRRALSNAKGMKTPAPMRICQATLSDEASPNQEHALLSALVDALHRCARCPLRCFPAGAPHLCRDECLLLGTLASIQHGDDDTLKLCLGALACPFRSAEVASAAGALAIALKALGKTLMPIPASAISDILIRSGQSEAQGATLH